jgi:hypothetical protein
MARIDGSPSEQLTQQEESVIFQYVAEVKSAMRRRGKVGLDAVGTLLLVLGRLFAASNPGTSASKLTRARFEDFIRDNDRARNLFLMLRLRLRLEWDRSNVQSIARYMDWLINIVKNDQLEDIKSILANTFDGLESFVLSLGKKITNKAIKSKPKQPLTVADIAELGAQVRSKRSSSAGNRLGSSGGSAGQGSANASRSESVSAGPKSAQSGSGSKRPAQRIVSIEDADNAESPQQPEAKRSRRSAEAAEVPKDPEVLLKTLPPRFNNSLTRIERVRSRQGDASTTSTILQRLYQAIEDFSDGIADLEDSMIADIGESEPAEEEQQSDNGDASAKSD